MAPKQQGVSLPADRKPLITILAILALTWLAYQPSLKNSFVNWDDPKYLLENHLVWDLTGDNVKELFFGTELNGRSYVPLSQLSFAVENSFIKPDYRKLDLFPEYARPMHRTNLLLHLLNTLLVFIFIRMLTPGRLIPAAVCALFFGIHPMHVESVAWITERKDVLFTLFFLWSSIEWVKYLRGSPSPKRHYIFSLVLFVLGLLAKSAAVTLPVVLGLIVYWREGKITKKHVMLLVPYFVLAVLHGIVTVLAIDSVNSIAAPSSFTFLERVMFAGYGNIMYLVKLVVPFGLTNYYPYPNLVNGHLPVIFWVAPVFALAIFGLVLMTFRKSRVFVFGYLFFLANVALTLQFVPVGPNIMCERYTYVPYIGLFFIVGYLIDRLVQSDGKDNRMAAPLLVFLGAGAVIFSWITFQRSKVWENSEVLWTDVISKYQYDVPVAYKNRGNFYGKRKRFDQALADYNIFLQLKQDDAGIYVNRGNIHGMRQQHQEALNDFTKAIGIDPKNTDALINRAITYSMQHRYELALSDYNRALQLTPEKRLDVYQNRGFTYLQTGRFKEAIEDFSAVLKEIPGNDDAWFYRGVAYFNYGDPRNAQRDFSQCIAINPSNSGAIYNRALAYRRLGDNTHALEDAQRAKALGYDVPDALIQQLQSGQ